MRHWLLRRPLPPNEINPAFRNIPRDYDKVFVNARLKSGDIVYLIGAYGDLYGWGHIEKKESYHDNELNRRAYRVTVTRPVLQQNLVSDEEVKRPPELARLFTTSVNLIELSVAQVSLLNGLLASRGMLMPPYMIADELKRPSQPEPAFPTIGVAHDVRVWMYAAYDKFKDGKPLNPQAMLVELWPQIPDFDYKSIDKRLMRFGVELTLLGILQLDPSTELVTEADRVIRFIKERIKSEPSIEKVTSEEVSETLEIQEERVGQIFGLMDHLGDFWNGAGGNENMPGYTTITIKDEHVKREYLKYESLEPLLERFSKTHQAENTEAPDEPGFVHTLLDWKFGERLEDALSWIDRLPADDVLAYDTDDLAKRVEQFLIPKLLVHADKPMRDQQIQELEDLAIDRKTGATGHIVLIPIEGEAEWLQEINMQTVLSDGHPLAFLDKERSWAYIKLTLSLEDPDGTLKQKRDERLALVAQYSAYVAQRISEFNRQLPLKMTEGLNKRKTVLLKSTKEAEALELPTTHNPRHAEKAIQIERLLETLNARFTRTNAHSNDIGNGGNTNEISDLHQDALAIARFMYENKFTGPRSITLRELREKTKLDEEDFDAADEYLLEAKIYDGTMGSDTGQRWLTPSGVTFARTQGGKRETAVEIRESGRTSPIDVFISHSSKDTEIAKALIRLLRSALNIPADRIRCTSVDGYRLPVGASTNEQLRTEVRGSTVFLGLITTTSIESTYVLFELGARWGVDLHLAPVLINSADKGLLRGPLAALNALSCDSSAQVFQLVENIASELRLSAANASSYQEYVDALVASSREAMVDQSVDTQARPLQFDFERMAKHVTNYFAGKPFRSVRFEILRKYVNETYSDHLLFEMIDRFPDQFRRVTLAGNSPAVGLLKPAATKSGKMVIDPT